MDNIVKPKPDTDENAKAIAAEKLAYINQCIQDEPSANLHLKRLELLDNVVENVPLVRETFVWLAAHEPSALENACAVINDEIKTTLSILTEPDERSENNHSDQPLLLLQQLEPLADYFPVIYLSYGLFLLDCAKKHRERSRRTKSPLDILEEILDSAEGKRNSTAFDPTGKDAITLHQQSYIHLSRAVTLLETEDSLRVIALESLAEVCEKLDDRVGAFNAYQESVTYGRDFSEKLDELGIAIRQQARERLLKYIDRLMAVGELDEAERLLKYATPADDNDDFRIRSADLAFLRGDLDAALNQYKDLLE